MKRTSNNSFFYWFYYFCSQIGIGW